MTRYEITTGPEHHSDTDRPWMALPSTTTIECHSVGSRCLFSALSSDTTAMEAALDADPDVISYTVVGEVAS